jgi:hypothetical protein
VVSGVAAPAVGLTDSSILLLPLLCGQAAFDGHRDIAVAMLRTPGVTVDDEDEASLNTALHYAASGGHDG